MVSQVYDNIVIFSDVNMEVTMNCIKKAQTDLLYGYDGSLKDSNSS